MGRGFLNIYSLPIAKWSTECLEERLGQSLCMLTTWLRARLTMIWGVLLKILGTPALILRTQTEAMISELLFCNRRCADCYNWGTTNSWYTQLLLSRGVFNVTEIYGDALTPDSKPDHRWLQQIIRGIPMIATQGFLSFISIKRWSFRSSARMELRILLVLTTFMRLNLPITAVIWILSD